MNVIFDSDPKSSIIYIGLKTGWFFSLVRIICHSLAILGSFLALEFKSLGASWWEIPSSFTLPETNSSPLKMDGWNTTFLLGRPIFRGELLVSGRVLIWHPNRRKRNPTWRITHLTPILCNFHIRLGEIDFFGSMIRMRGHVNTPVSYVVFCFYMFLILD